MVAVRVLLAFAWVAVIYRLCARRLRAPPNWQQWLSAAVIACFVWRYGPQVTGIRAYSSQAVPISDFSSTNDPYDLLVDSGATNHIVPSEDMLSVVHNRERARIDGLVLSKRRQWVTLM